MKEQAIMMKQLNDFLERRGLRANFVAQQVGISEASLYSFKQGHRLLTQRQLEKLKTYIEEYDRKLDGDAVEVQAECENTLKHFGIALKDSGNETRSLSDVLEDIHARWDDLTATDKLAVANAFAGAGGLRK